LRQYTRTYGFTNVRSNLLDKHMFVSYKGSTAIPLSPESVWSHRAYCQKVSLEWWD